MSRGDQDCKRSKRVNHWASCILCGLMLLAHGPIHGENTEKTRKHTPNVKASASEIKSRNQSLLALYSAEIETTADKIISGSPSPAARRQALIWKAEAIPVMQASLLNNDPIVAVIDTWAFVFQMTEFIERPEWKNTIGNFYPAVGETLSNMNVQMEELVHAAAPKANIADVRERVRGWAEANPIQDSLASRRSAGPDVIKNVGATSLGTRSSIKTLAKGMGDLSARLDSYNAYLPKQARWQAELLLEDLKRDSQVNSALSDIQALSDNIGTISDNIGTLSDTAGKLDSERLSLQEFVNQERVQTQEFVQQERVQTLDAVQVQRIDTLAALHAERLGVTSDLRAERLAATADLRGERRATLDALRDQEVAIVNDMRATLDNEGRNLIDHFFLRCLELMLLTLVLCFLLAWILLRSSTGPVERKSHVVQKDMHKT